MSPALPVINRRRVVRAREKAGFVIERIAGSHHMLSLPDDPRHAVTVPVHGSRELRPGTLRAIIRQVGFTVEELCQLL